MSYTGWVKVTASNFHLDVSTNISALDHRPQFHIGKCSMSLDNFDYEFGGDVVPWWLNMFRKPVSTLLKATISNVACGIANSALAAKYNTLLHYLPLRLPIWWKFYLEYAIDEPVYTRKYFDVEAAAVVSYSSKQCNYTAVEEWPEKDMKPKMAVMWIYESLPNCILSSFHEGDYLHFTLTKDTPALSTFLQTSCSTLSVCIGKFFKKLQTDYPDKYIDLYVHSYEAPYVEMADDVVSFFAKFAIDFYINPMSWNRKVLARLILDSTTMIYPAISDNRLVGQIIGIDTKFKAESSEIGEISKLFLKAFAKAFSGTAKAMLESILHQGIPLPVFENVTISDRSDVGVVDKFVRINAELEYLK
ncbi:LBP / BPI / CETP family protein [Oesophagostomum dentatum]|uniref:LBP / BPI / CETP family protein n=1 Tax=Oesophagostomum dentatum TaxID=61180 RepID=A0A0B1T9F3_OESDE|nr:LBP / BPI / CETP family protein [Oesophagostomum dentatum]